jgi:hypothetical protein
MEPADPADPGYNAFPDARLSDRLSSKQGDRA